MYSFLAIFFDKSSPKGEQNNNRLKKNCQFLLYKMVNLHQGHLNKKKNCAKMKLFQANGIRDR